MNNPVYLDPSCPCGDLREELVASLGLAPGDLIAMSFDLRRPPEISELLTMLSPQASRSPLFLVSLVSHDAHDKAGTPRAMPAAAACVAPIAEAAKQFGMNVTLAPRLGTWLEHPQDAVRLAMRVNKRHVGVALDCNAWQQTDGRDEGLPDVLRLVLPKLNAMTLSPHGDLASWRDDETYKRIAPRLAAQGWRGPVVLRPTGA